ncbi:MAG: type II toxin-antitoxin system RatA family toxin [Alphaproteobacteria bacterium]
MPKHAEKRVLPYRAEEMFDLVAAVERYPEFLPWCRGARILKNEGQVIDAELIIGFRMFRERFTSRVILERPHRIDVAYAEGPFHHLDNHWKFADGPEGGCLIDFYVDFEFRSRFFHRVMEMLFTEAVHRMVSAFDVRARRLYGPGTSPIGSTKLPAPARRPAMR